MDTRELPPLTALRAFEAAARHLSFKHAAAELSLTPTAISHQVRLLEERLGVPLFVRGTRRVDLTPAGQGLFPALRDGLDAMARGVQAVRPRQGPRGLVLSTTMAFASRWLLPRLARFAGSQPGIALHLHTSDRPVDLAGGDAHLAIRYGSGRYPGLRSTPLLPSRFAPVCAPALAVDTMEELSRVPLIGFEWLRRDAATPDWPLWFERAGGRAGTAPTAFFRRGPRHPGRDRRARCRLGQPGTGGRRVAHGPVAPAVGSDAGRARLPSGVARTGRQGRRCRCGEGMAAGRSGRLRAAPCRTRFVTLR